VPDVYTRQKRSEIMSRVKAIDTGPEQRVRKLAHRLGYRFRLHRKDLPGTPDLVFPRRRVALCVHGCFWHRHAGCAAASMPQSNVGYWTRKFARNVARDAAAAEALTRQGWKVVVIWECETRDETELAGRIRCALGASPQA
jgi:DNA mismatch endonuclease (patch repair protein)